MSLSLRWRLTLVYAVVFAVLAAASGVASYRILARQLDADATAELDELTSGLHGYLRFDGGTPKLAFDPDDPDQVAFVQEAIRYYQVFDARTGALLVQSDALAPLGAHFSAAEVLAFGAQPSVFDLRTDYRRLRMSNRVISPAPDESYLLQVGISLEPMDRALERLLGLLLVTLPAGLLAAVLVGRWMAGVALAPLSRLATAAGAIDIRDLRRRLPLRGTHDEVDDVASAFNATLGRLEHSVDEMRQFSTALAHELRTPLAALRGEIELTLLRPGSSDDVSSRLASQLEEIDKLAQLVDRLLTLARAEAGEIPLARERVDLAELGRSLADQLELLAQSKSIVLDRRIEGPVVVLGDTGWLERLVLNLLDNALKFTGEGGRVALRIENAAGSAEIAVTDTGIGIATEALPHVFERFFRADPARTSATAGVGLGLSLARWIVERHGGRIEVLSRPGHGSTFTVRLPLAP